MNNIISNKNNNTISNKISNKNNSTTSNTTNSKISNTIINKINKKVGNKISNSINNKNQQQNQQEYVMFGIMHIATMMSTHPINAATASTQTLRNSSRPQANSIPS